MQRDRAKRLAPTERATLPGRHCHPCPLSCPLVISSGLRARTVSATRDRAAAGEEGRCAGVSFISGPAGASEGLAPKSPHPTPAISHALLCPQAPASLFPPFPGSRRKPALPAGDRCTGRWRPARRCPAPGASLGAPGLVGRAGGSAGEGRAGGRCEARPGAPLAGRARARALFLASRRAAPLPPPARVGSRPLRVLSRVSPRPSPDSPLLSFLPLFLLSPRGLKMPSATSHSGSGSKSSGPPPPSGSSGSEAAAGAGAAAPASQHPATGTGAVQTEAMKQILGVIDKKLRNLEKKKVPGVGGEGRGGCGRALRPLRPWSLESALLSVSGALLGPLLPPPGPHVPSPRSAGASCPENGLLEKALVT